MLELVGGCSRSEYITSQPAVVYNETWGKPISRFLIEGQVCQSLKSENRLEVLPVEARSTSHSIVHLIPQVNPTPGVDHPSLCPSYTTASRQTRHWARSPSKLHSWFRIWTWASLFLFLQATHITILTSTSIQCILWWKTPVREILRMEKHFLEIVFCQPFSGYDQTLADLVL